MLLYRFLISLAAPVLALLLALRVLRGQESWGDLAERLGKGRAAEKGPWIWVHGASNGELTSARALLEELQMALPDHRLLITCNSLSGKALAQGWSLDGSDVRLAPLDLIWMQRRMLAGRDLRLFILLEGDFWPNRMRAAAQSGAGLALVGGRLSAGSARIWARFGALAQSMFGAFHLISAQDGQSQARLRALGAKETAFAEQVNLKSNMQPLSDAPLDARRAQVWLAASTHAGEDELLLRAQRIARQSDPELRLILAPRHPKRGAEIAALAEGLGLSAALRSAGAAAEGSAAAVYIADTLGEMELWYAKAQSCFVAGSLVDKGGHTPFEPAAFGCALIHGPNVGNFAEPYAALRDIGGSIEAQTPEAIAAAVLELRAPARAAQLTKAARHALDAKPDMGALTKRLADLARGC